MKPTSLGHKYMDYGHLKSILDTAGGSVYLADIPSLRANLQLFLQPFRRQYRNTNLAYSYKTNYLAEFCLEAERLEMYAEVVSGTEYQIARQYDVPYNHIIFNGPVKTETELQAALQHGSMVNIECWEEISKIRSLCREDSKCHFSLGLRCSFSSDDKTCSRFGFTSTDGQLQSAFRQLHDIRNCSVVGLQCH
ncbi:MAG: hypothetical protein N2C12_03485, partial [Planctomycetales bacterium]